MEGIIVLIYDMEWNELCAADFGVHTTRTRFFGVFRCDGKPIAWPIGRFAR